MDNNTVLPTPPLPPSPPVSPTSPTEPIVTQPKSKRFPWIPVILALLVIGIASYFGYRYFLFRPLPAMPNSPSSSITSSSPLPPVSAYEPISDTENKLVYLRDPDPNTVYGYQAWLIDPNTGEEEQLPITNFSQAYKFLGSTKLYYLPVSEEGEFRILDLATGEETSYSLITHPDPDANNIVSINSITDISPDGNWIVFQASFYLVCPSPSPIPSGFEGGFGPCMPDENLSTPTGNYLYDFVKREATPISELFRVSRWDISNHKLYYITDNTAKALDLVNKTTTYVDSTSNFGYFSYPLFKSKRLVKFEATTGNSGEPAFGKIFLLDLTNNQTNEIDSANDWAILQPFVSGSPDETDLLYIRTTIEADGIRRSYLRRFNLANNTSTLLTPEDSNLSYSIYGTWLDNHTFITSVDTVESENYTNINNYLVKIDLTTAEIARLTPHDKVYRFNNN
ncbi:MAG: hypothetical protein ABII80_02540 [bacterium]